VTNTPGLRHSWIISQEPEIFMSKYFGEFYTKNIARGSQIIDLCSTEKSNDVIALHSSSPFSSSQWDRTLLFAFRKSEMKFWSPLACDAIVHA
jgi:hypothetical protein